MGDWKLTHQIHQLLQPYVQLTVMYVRLDEDENGFIMALVLGDWLDDIGYDPTRSVWEP